MCFTVRGRTFLNFVRRCLCMTESEEYEYKPREQENNRLRYVYKANVEDV